jgi:hypothetical protein
MRLKLSFHTIVILVLLAVVSAMLVSCSDDDPAPTAPSNRAPEKPSLPEPEDSTTYVRETLAVSWEGGDPDGDLVLYSVQVREGEALVFTGQTIYKSMETGLFLLRSQTYTWRVIATDGLLITEGDWWTFFTPDYSNEPPYPPADPHPADGAVDVLTLGTVLTWSADDPDTDDVLTYTVFFGTDSDPPLAAGGLDETSWELPLLEYDTEYFWFVVVTDSRDESTAGPVWSFTTRSQPGGVFDWIISLFQG